MREEISKDYTKLSWAIEKKQAMQAYMIIFNRSRPEKAYYNQLDHLEKAHPSVKGIYVESVQGQNRHYRIKYFNEYKWSKLSN